ncbi:MAG: DUF4199 domain-containing protein [Muribaculaceae bacterium]|nr:DUF4199 domain-containing protein [Muribaculaceae bacterium]
MEERKSVFKRGAECGLPMGLYMSVMTLATLYSDKASLLSLLFLVMLLMGPVVIYRFQRQYFLQEHGMTEYSALWMLGILMVIYGALISGAVTLVVLQWLRPTLLYDQAQQFLDLCKATPDMQAQFGTFVDVVQKMVDENLLPKPIDTVFSTFWFVAFSGSMLSAITAAFANRAIKNQY